MSQTHPHTAKSVFVGCIDDRLVQSGAKFIADHGDAFQVRLAGGGGSLLDPEARPIVLKQIAAAHVLGGVTEIYLESHTDCGAYRLAGVAFDSPEAELAHLYADLDEAADYARTAMIEAGADASAVVVHTQVVDPAGKVQERA